MKIISQDTNLLGKTWLEYDKEIGSRLKNYLLITPTKSQLKKAKSMWRKGHTEADIVSYIILSSNPLK